MELESHVEELTKQEINLADARNSLAEAANRRSLRNLYGILQPELYRAEGRTIKELGRTAGTLLKLTPHIPEIYRTRKSRSAGEI
jgi:hypothetical protein